jgi:diadenosine tetraphosphate (Ap4A) HIT family hydrolase
MTSTWMRRERWDALVQGDGCRLCAEIASGEAENTHGFLVADLRNSQLRLSREQHVPGWCVLTCRRHVREPHELAPEERGDFFTDLLRAGKALDELQDLST